MTSQNSQHYQNLAVLSEIVEDEFARRSSSVTSLEMLDAVRPRYDQHSLSSGEVVRVHLDPMLLLSGHVATFVVRNSDSTFTAFTLSEIMVDDFPGSRIKSWGFKAISDDEYKTMTKVWDVCSNLDDLRQRRIDLPHQPDKWDLYQLAQQVWSVCQQIAEILGVDKNTAENDVPSVINRVLQYVFLVHNSEVKAENERLIVADSKHMDLTLTDRHVPRVMHATGLWLQEGGILGFGDAFFFRPASYAYQGFRVGPEYAGGIMEKWINEAKAIRSEREARDLLNNITDSGVSHSDSTDFDWRDIYSHIPGFRNDLSNIDDVRKVVKENDHEYATTGFVMQDESSSELVYVYLIDDGELFWKSWSRSDEKEW
jgi:hypothetical protein